MARNGNRTLWTAFIVGIALALLGCTAEGPTGSVAEPLDESIYANPDVNDSSPRLRLLLTDAPIDDIDNVWLTISQISAHPQHGSAVILSTESQTIDLLSLRYGLASTLGISSLPEGDYNQIRLLVTESTLVIDGVTHDLFIPSGSSKGVTINFNFEVDNDEISTMLIDWDASASIHYAPGEGYIMHSVIQVRSYRSEPLDTNVPGAPSVESPSHPDSNAWEQGNAATFRFSASDDIGLDGFSYTIDQIPSTVPDEVVDSGYTEQGGQQQCQPSEYPTAPTCAEIEPQTVIEGGLINIYGTSFGRWASLITVTIGGEEAELVQVTPSEIIARVPDGLGAKSVAVATPKGEVTCGRDIQVVGDTSFCPDGQYEPGKGLLGKVYEICQDRHDDRCVLPDFSTLGEPHSTLVACEVDVPNHYFSEGFPGVDSTLVEWFAIRWTGSLIAPKSGTYNFRIAADDGAKVYIDGRLLVNNDGLHAVRSKDEDIYLDAGEHEFVLEYFQGPRWYIAQQLYWTVPGENEEIIPKDYFLLPRNENAGAEAEPLCFCSGHGEGAYNYRAYGVNDGDGHVYSIDMYSDEPVPVDLGVMKHQNKVLEDFESLAILNGQFYGVNNTGHNLIKNRLFKVLVDQAANGLVPVEEVGMLKHNGTVVQDLDCLATSPAGELYAISTATDKLYSVSIDNAALTYVMDIPGEVEGCAFGPSGMLYGTDNSGSNSMLIRVDIEAGLIEQIGQLPWATDVEALGWHPDGFLYAGIDNQSNDYPAIAKIRPSDAVVVDYMDPSVKLSDIEGIDFDYVAEQESCICDMELNEDASASFGGNFTVSDANNDGFSERIIFSGDQMLSQVDPGGDKLAEYVGVNNSCNKARSRIGISQVELDPNDYTGNRFRFKDTRIASGFSLELLNPNTCNYRTVVTADIETEREYLKATGNKAAFWLRIVDPQVDNVIGSAFLAALSEQDEAGVMMFNMQTDQPSFQNHVRRGQTITGSYAVTLQAGENVVIGSESDLPVCPDPSLHEPNKNGSARFDGLADGVWHFHVRSVDDSGNWSETTHYQIMIDSSAPDAPTVSSQTHPSQEIEYPNPDPVFTLNASDLSGIQGYSYTLDQNPATEPNNSVDTSAGEVSFADLEPGTYFFHVAAQNGSGLWSAPAHYKIIISDPQNDLPAPPPGYAMIQGDSYIMGSPTDHYDHFADETQHWVKLDSFLMQQREVSNADYRACVADYTVSDTACDSDADCEGEMHYCNDDGFCATGCEHEPGPDASYHRLSSSTLPVTSIAFEDAQRYCTSQGLRLPTEAEWEFAAKGHDNDRYPWGNEYSSDRANGQDQMNDGPMPVGSFDGTKSGKGDGTVCYNGRCLYDMAGNVEEWVADWYHTYGSAPNESMALDNPAVDTEAKCLDTCSGDSQCIAGCQWKIVRGGSFTADRMRMRVFYRERRLPIMKSENTGFRCAMDWDGNAEVPEEVCDGVDNDGNGQVDESFLNSDNDDQANCIDDDDDNDGIADEEDNCPLIANPNQYDPDLDGFGEVCDPDGEILTVTYAGLLRPKGVAIGADGTIYVAGSTDGFSLESSNDNAKGAVLSISPFGMRTGQVTLADLAMSGSQWRDYRPSALTLATNGYLYATDDGSSYDDGIWRIARNPVTKQLGVSQSPVERDGDADGTCRYYLGMSNSRGIDRTSGHALSPDGRWMLITRDSFKDVRRVAIEEDGAISDDYGPLGEEIAAFTNAVEAPAVDSRGWYYYLRYGRLYRQKVLDGVVQAPELISDTRAFKHTVALQFDANDNLYALRYKGQSNVWPFRGSQADKIVPAESGFITKVAASVLAAVNPSNIIRHGDETMQQLIYGGPASREIRYSGKRLNAPRGFVLDARNGNIIVANTDSDEVVVLSPAAQSASSISLSGSYDAVE